MQHIFYGTLGEGVEEGAAKLLKGWPSEDMQTKKRVYLIGLKTIH